MKRITILLIAIASLAGILAFTGSGHAHEDSAPVFVTEISPG